MSKQTLIAYAMFLIFFPPAFFKNNFQPEPQIAHLVLTDTPSNSQKTKEANFSPTHRQKDRQ
jgi:hypothetical protein